MFILDFMENGRAVIFLGLSVFYFPFLSYFFHVCGQSNIYLHLHGKYLLILFLQLVRACPDDLLLLLYCYLPIRLGSYTDFTLGSHNRPFR